jgi:hypothetical protein
MSAVDPRNEGQEFCGIKPKFVLYWISLAVASWKWSIILQDNRLNNIPRASASFFYLFFYFFMQLQGIF